VNVSRMMEWRLGGLPDEASQPANRYADAADHAERLC